MVKKKAEMQGYTGITLANHDSPDTRVFAREERVVHGDMLVRKTC